MSRVPPAETAAEIAANICENSLERSPSGAIYLRSLSMPKPVSDMYYLVDSGRLRQIVFFEAITLIRDYQVSSYEHFLRYAASHIHTPFSDDLYKDVVGTHIESSHKYLDRAMQLGVKETDQLLRQAFELMFRDLVKYSVAYFFTNYEDLKHAVSRS